MRQKNSIVRKMRNFSGKRDRRGRVLRGWQSTSWPRPRGAERPGMPSLSCADDKKSLPHGREGRTRARAGLARKPGRRGQVLCGWQSTSWPRPRGAERPGMPSLSCADDKKSLPHGREGRTRARAGLARKPGRRGQVLCGWQSTPWPRPRGMLLTDSARPAQVASRRAMPGPRRGSTHTRRPSRAPGRIDRPHP